MKLSLKLFRLFVQFLTWGAIVSYLHLYDGVLHFVITWQLPTVGKVIVIKRGSYMSWETVKSWMHIEPCL